jgi:hypothetical protein
MDKPETERFEIRDYLREELFPHFLCPGCGHGMALRALLWAVHELSIAKDELAVVSGIGCAGRLGAYIDANTFHVTHGRPLAFATGLALARPDQKVVVITGDGDCLAIGGNHLIHACRRNLDLTCVMLNNEVYGMTGGQASPTTSETRFTTTTPFGNTEPAFDACKLAEALGLYRDLRAQERARLLAGDDPEPEAQHAPGVLRQQGGPAVPPERLPDRRAGAERPPGVRRDLPAPRRLGEGGPRRRRLTAPWTSWKSA